MLLISLTVIQASATAPLPLPTFPALKNTRTFPVQPGRWVIKLPADIDKLYFTAPLGNWKFQPQKDAVLLTVPSGERALCDVSFSRHKTSNFCFVVGPQNSADIRDPRAPSMERSVH